MIGMDDFTKPNISGCYEKSVHHVGIDVNDRSRISSDECFDVDFESFDFFDEDQQPKERESPCVTRARNNTDSVLRVADDGDEDNGEDEEDLHDEDIEDKAVDPPPGYIRIRPSKFNMIPSTVFVEYPKALGMVRSDASELQSLQGKEMHYRCQWARNCIKNAFTRAGFEDSAQNWTVMWAQHQSAFTLRGLNCLQKVNHFPGSWALGRKDRLSRTIWAMKRLYPSEFNFHPESFVLPGDKQGLERCAKADVFHNKSAKNSKHKRLWITKPVASSCGKGIKVITAERALVLSRANDRKMLVQRYLSDPYLINKKKFDMRLYVLVTGVDPLRIYLHDEGLIRMATENFSVKSLKNPFVHLTNYSINKKSEHFFASSKFNFGGGTETETESSSKSDATKLGRDGFKWTLKAFKTWLAEKESPAIMEHTMGSVHSLLVKTILAAEPDLSHSLHATANYRTNCFELFGFDVFLDAQLIPHLIEVNVSPSLAGSSPLDMHIKGVLVADVCHVTGFHPHDETILGKYHSTHSNISFNATNNNNNINNIQNSGTGYPSQAHRPSSAGGTGIRSSSISGSASAGSMTPAQCKERDKEKDYVNPFSFASLSKLMAGQAEWRKDMTMRNINLASLDHADAAWYMLLMVEDEFDRAEQSKFQKLHPAPESIDKYMPLYKNARFSDQLLGKWLKGGMSEGKGNKSLLPKRFKKKAGTDIETELEAGVELEEETRVPPLDCCDQHQGESEQGEGGMTDTLLRPRGTGVALARARGRLASPAHSPTACWRPVSATGTRTSRGTGTGGEGRPSSARTRSADALRPSSTGGPTGIPVPPEQPNNQIEYNIGKEVIIVSKSKKKITTTKDPFFNLKNNLKQQKSYLYDPLQRNKKITCHVQPFHKIKKQHHTSVVFEPSLSGRSGHSHGHHNNAVDIGDMYKHLLLRNMRTNSNININNISGAGGASGRGGSGVAKGTTVHKHTKLGRDRDRDRYRYRGRSVSLGGRGLGEIAIQASATGNFNSLQFPST